MSLNHVKLHGSVYGVAARDAEMAHAVCDAADVFEAPVLGMIGTEHEKVYTARGHGFLAEYYVDLDYSDDGKLIVTREHEAIDPGEAFEPRRSGATRGRDAFGGAKDIKVGASTICVHSDTPGADLVAQAVHDRLVSEGFIAPRSRTLTVF